MTTPTDTGLAAGRPAEAPPRQAPPLRLPPQAPSLEEQAQALGVPELAEDGAPIFGGGSAEGPSFEPFWLTVVPDGKPPYRERFEAHVDADAGAIMELLAARTQLEQGAAMARLLAGILRNDDGCPAEWQPARDPETGLLAVATDENGLDLHGDDGPLYRDWDGALVSDLTLLAPTHEQGSSRRRFAAIMDAQNLRVTFAALAEIARWVVTRSGGGGTRRPVRSPTTARQRDGGSRGKSRSRASAR